MSDLLWLGIGLTLLTVAKGFDMFSTIMCMRVSPKVSTVIEAKEINVFIGNGRYKYINLAFTTIFLYELGILIYQYNIFAFLLFIGYASGAAMAASAGNFRVLSDLYRALEQVEGLKIPPNLEKLQTGELFGDEDKHSN